MDYKDIIFAKVYSRKTYFYDLHLFYLWTPGIIETKSLHYLSNKTFKVLWSQISLANELFADTLKIFTQLCHTK